MASILCHVMTKTMSFCFQKAQKRKRHRATLSYRPKNANDGVSVLPATQKWLRLAAAPADLETTSAWQLAIVFSACSSFRERNPNFRKIPKFNQPYSRKFSKGEIEDDFAFIQTMLEENDRSDGVKTGSDGTEDETYEPRSNEYEENEDDDEEFLVEAFDFVNKNEVSKIVVRTKRDDIVIPEFDYQRHINEEYQVLRGSDDEDNGMTLADFAQAPFGEVHLKLEMVFPTLKLFKDVVKDYDIYLRRVVKFKTNGKIRCSVACVVEHCEWKTLCSWAEHVGGYQIKTFYPTHTCSRVLKNPLVDRKWVGRKLVDAMRSYPNITAKDAAKFMAYNYQVQLA
ncbi:hypothetical protein CRG98_010527 [Punica granatum]|uniref:Uncharacterized protein n=1 Tax=Punica granatum TaxID=22663 RepID=A0A2I0KKL6_PUNGR|nr:hypothetical protein CRG98_010527 [Punica granatum]